MCGGSLRASRLTSNSVYEEECEAEPTDRKKVMILGSGPNRIGQGIEFDYCCCHASFSLQEMAYESIMVNCNPETVSTDYDTSDRLYFEPLTLENVLNVFDTERPDGVIVQFGGQTPLNLALPLKAHGVPIVGTDPESIDLAEDRDRFGKLLEELDIPQPGRNNGDNPRRRARCRQADWISRARPAPATCSADAPWSSPTTSSTIEAYMRDAVALFTRPPDPD